MYNLFTYLRQHVAAPGPIIFSCHNHDDLGLATANTLAAIEAGVTQVEGTINGIGERAGNVALEEIAMAVKTRGDQYGYETGINTRELYRTSKLVQSLTGVSVQPNKAIVGANAFAHESGIHQDGVLKDRSTYEIMSPDDVGVPESSLVLGKHSGRHAFRNRLEKLGCTLSEAELDRAFARFKEVADRKKYVTDQDLEALASDEQQHKAADRVQLLSFQVFAGSDTLPTATVKVSVDGQGPSQEAASGDGPVEALYRAVDRAAGFGGTLVHFQLKAVTGGQDAMGEVVVKVRSGDRLASGRGASTDVLEASVRAYVAAVNKLLSGYGVVAATGD
jgi:2-isopropylmalate synthase